MEYEDVKVPEFFLAESLVQIPAEWTLDVKYRLMTILCKNSTKFHISLSYLYLLSRIKYHVSTTDVLGNFTTKYGVVMQKRGIFTHRTTPPPPYPSPFSSSPV